MKWGFATGDDILTIENVTGIAGGRLKVYDIVGREQVLPAVRNGAKTELSIAGLSVGVYVLRYEFGGETRVVKFLKG